MFASFGSGAVRDVHSPIRRDATVPSRLTLASFLTAQTPATISKVLAPHKPVPPVVKTFQPPRQATLRSMIGGLWMIDASLAAYVRVEQRAGSRAGISLQVSFIKLAKRHLRAGQVASIILTDAGALDQRMRLLASTKVWSTQNIWIKFGRKRSSFLTSCCRASQGWPGAQS